MNSMVSEITAEFYFNKHLSIHCNSPKIPPVSEDRQRWTTLEQGETVPDEDAVTSFRAKLGLEHRLAEADYAFTS